MTGYGKDAVSNNTLTVTVEIRTLNSKQLDINLRVPAFLKEKEIEIRKSIAGKLVRGKIDVSMIIEFNDVETAPVIDKSIAAHYYSQLKDLAVTMNQNDFNNYLDIIVKMPEVFVQREVEVGESEFNAVTTCLVNALTAVDVARSNEGSDLEVDFRLRNKNILDLLDQVENYDKQRVTKIRERILNNIQKFMDVLC